jgi:hypothetical protein
MHDRVESESMSSEAEEDVKKLCEKTKKMVNVRCDLGEVKIILPSTWKDNIDHDCKSIEGSVSEGLNISCEPFLASFFLIFISLLMSTLLDTGLLSLHIRRTGHNPPPGLVRVGANDCKRNRDQRLNVPSEAWRSSR